jgi:hypothetical protein
MGGATKNSGNNSGQLVQIAVSPKA